MCITFFFHWLLLNVHSCLQAVDSQQQWPFTLRRILMLPLVPFANCHKSCSVRTASGSSLCLFSQTLVNNFFNTPFNLPSYKENSLFPCRHDRSLRTSNVKLGTLFLSLQCQVFHMLALICIWLEKQSQLIFWHYKVFQELFLCLQIYNLF